MHFPTALSLMLLGGLQAAQATISTGTFTSTSGNLNVAWISGDDPCKTGSNGKWNFGIISNANANPCGKSFTLRNGFTYRLEFCGTDQFQLVNNDGSFNAKCTPKEYKCSNGLFVVRQSWQC